MAAPRPAAAARRGSPRQGGESERQVLLIAAWQHTDLYTDSERAALALAEAMTVLPGVRDVPDEIYQRASAAFTEQQFAAIAWTITAMNGWNRLGVLGHMQPPPLG
jgi:alkylhydroperoxidase family enzyme